MAILNIGRMNMNCEQQAIAIGDDMAFAPMDTLAGIVAARTSGMGRRSALAVDHGRRRFRGASEGAAGTAHQRFGDLLPTPAIAPSVEIALNR